MQSVGKHYQSHTKGMKEETITVLKNLRMGGNFPVYKPLGEVEKEIFETLAKLNNLGVLKLESKTKSKTYLVNDSKLLSKFIELRDFDKLVEYIESEPKNMTNNFNNNFENSTIGQVVQSPEKIDLNNPIQQKIVQKTDKKASKKSTIEILSWVIGIIVGIIAIYKFIIEDLVN